MSVNRIYESSGSGSWLREADLNGKSHKVEILEVDLVGVKGDDNTIHDKIELKFNGKEKSLLLNKTNAKTIASGLGGLCQMFGQPQKRVASQLSIRFQP